MRARPNPALQDPKPPFPPALLAADMLANLGIGISLAELLTQSGRPLGWVSAELVWPLFWGSVVVAAVCGYRMVAIIRQRARAKAG